MIGYVDQEMQKFHDYRATMDKKTVSVDEKLNRIGTISKLLAETMGKLNTVEGYMSALKEELQREM